MSNALDCSIENISKVIETEHHMLLMSNQYSKDTLAPKSIIGMVPQVPLGYNLLNIKTHMTIGTTYRADWRHHDFGIVKDPYIENRYYILLNNRHSNESNNNNVHSYICFINDDGEDTSVVRNVTVNIITWEKIVDIDDTFLYVVARNNNNSYVYLYRINKYTGDVYAILNRGGARNYSNLIHKDETYLYFITRLTLSTWEFTRFNKSNAEVRNKTISVENQTYIDDNSGATVTVAVNNLFIHSNCVTNENFYYENGKYYWLMPQKNGAAYSSKGHANDNLVAYCYNSNLSFDNANVITIKRINIQNNNELTWQDGTGCSLYRYWVIGEYLYYAIYNENETQYSIAIPVQGIHKFKIHPGFELEWISVQRINTDKQIISMVFNSDRSRILIGYYQTFDILKYNEETTDYELTNKEIVQVMSAGFDTLDRIWYITTDYSVHVQNVDDPQEVEMHFEYLHYTYEGSNIYSYISFEAKSFSNGIPMGKYILKLSGNAVFKDNQSKTLEFQYSGGVRTFDFIVTGPKRITCSAEFIKEW